MSEFLKHGERLATCWRLLLRLEPEAPSPQTASLDGERLLVFHTGGAEICVVSQACPACGAARTGEKLTDTREGLACDACGSSQAIRGAQASGLPVMTVDQEVYVYRERSLASEETSDKPSN